MPWPCFPPLWTEKTAQRLLEGIQRPFHTAIGIEVYCQGKKICEAHPLPGCALSDRDSKQVCRAMAKAVRKGGQVWVRESLVGAVDPVSASKPHNLYGVALGKGSWQALSMAQARAAGTGVMTPASVLMPWPEMLPKR